MTDHDPLPPPPTFSDEVLEECRQNRDAMRLVIEWYRYAGMVVGVAASVLPDAPGLPPLPRQHYLALTGLLLRCAQIMRAALELAAKHRFGDALRILARSICESAVKVMWLCHHGDDVTFRRYIADGLTAELEFRRHIEQNVAERGATLPIEKRMLASISRFIEMSGLSEAEIAGTKKLPNVVAMYEQTGGGRPLYVVVQKFGSHATHGTWLDLAVHYLAEGDDGPVLRYDYVLPDEDSLRMTALLVLDAIFAFLDFVHPPPFSPFPPPDETAAYVRNAARAAQEGMLSTMEISYGNDFVTEPEE